jgi:hypothetical protein
MLVNVSENNLAVRRKPLLVTILCVLSFASQVEGQDQTKEGYERAQIKEVLRIKRLNTDLLTKELVLGFKMIEKDYRDILRSGTNGRNQKELAVLREGLTYRILTLSDSDIQKDAPKFVTANSTLQRELLQAGNRAAIPNDSQRQQFRELVYTEAMPLLNRLLKEGNLLSRSAALQRLLDLESIPQRSQGRMKMFDDVDDVYIRVLSEPTQPDAVKTLAATAMRTYLQKADAVSTIELAFAEAIVKELARPHLSTAYQINLLQSLEFVRAPRLLAGKKEALIYCAMAQLIKDRNIDILVRCRAARVMGRVGWDRDISFDILAWAVSDLTVDTAVQFNAAQDQKDPKWAHCGWYLYTAFHHENSNETQGKPPSELPKGFLNRAPESNVVRDAYANSHVVMAHLMFVPQNVKKQNLTSLFDWVRNSKPASLEFDAACAPF